MEKFVTIVFVLSLLASGLYVAALSQTGTFFLTTATLALVTTLSVVLVRAMAIKRSPSFVLHLLFSGVAGLGVATFIVTCANFLFDQTLPPAISLYMRFLLPVLFGTLSFWGMRAFPWFRAEELNSTQRGRRFIPDHSALEDGRIVDLARLGLFDGRLFLPSFVFEELRMQAEAGDEQMRIRARKSLDSIRRLQALPKVEFRIENCSSPSETDPVERLTTVAHKKGAYLLTTENLPTRADEAGTIVSLECIAHALRPPIPKGEVLSIKIQRIGKEPKQGIGYLEDGTMVVVNGGGDFLGRTVRTQVLSQKYSSSGKIVFCNVREDCEERIPSPAPYLVSVDINST